MQSNDLNSIEKIESRICKLQISHVSLQEKLKSSQNNFERNLDESALRIIDILDLIEITKENMNLSKDVHSYSQIIFKKIEKRLADILKKWEVQEIIFKNGQVEVGKTRVIETRPVSSSSEGSIVEVCRKGYQRGDKTIRPADVITGVCN